MGRGWESFDLHVTKSLFLHEQTIKDNSQEDSAEQDPAERASSDSL